MAGSSRERATRIERRKKLSQLFERGRYIHFSEDGKVVPAEEGQWSERVWIASPNPLQRDSAMREGAAARARVELDSRDATDSPEWLAVRAFVSALDKVNLIEFLLNSKAGDRLNEARRDVLREDEWDNFNQLRDAMRQFEESGAERDDPEWASLIERDIEFARQVTDRADQIRVTAQEAYELMPSAELEKEAIALRVDNAGASAFVVAYENWMMYYSVREPEDHDTLMFDEVTEFQSMPRVFQNAVANVLSEFIDESSEAKN